MTLILGMSKAEGVYLAVDCRITDSRSQRLLDDQAGKILDIKFSPIEDGPRALLGYTGVAKLSDGTPTRDWIRETIRGETLTFDATMRHLNERLHRDFAPLRHPLILNVLAIHGPKRYLGGLSNLKRNGAKVWVEDHFGYSMTELEEPSWFANGSGAITLLRRKKLADQIQGQLNVSPRDVADHMNLLASVNRGVATLDQSVSPHSIVMYVGDGDTRATARIFRRPGEQIEIEDPAMIFLGVDLTSEFRMVRD